MSPRPLEPESSNDFESFVARARDGEVDAAIESVLAAAADSAHREWRARAVDALTRIGRLAEAGGDFERAERAAHEASRLAPGFADVHYRLACVRLQMQRRSEARRDLEAALRIHPRYVAARVELALLDAREGMLGEALGTLRQLSGEVREEGATSFGRGLASLEQAEWDEAGAHFREALSLGDANLAVQEFHARRERGDRAGARRVLVEALAIHDGFADLHCLLGTVELEEGSFDDALASFCRALELQPDYHAARLQLARTLESLGDPVQAEEQAALVLEVDPRHPQALELCERWTRLHRKRAAAGTALIRPASGAQTETA
jgi:tetratricopeptide (TPR) repeat protein